MKKVKMKRNNNVRLRRLLKLDECSKMNCDAITRSFVEQNHFKI